MDDADVSSDRHDVLDHAARQGVPTGSVPMVGLAVGARGETGGAPEDDVGGEARDKARDEVSSEAASHIAAEGESILSPLPSAQPPPPLATRPSPATPPSSARRSVPTKILRLSTEELRSDDADWREHIYERSQPAVVAGLAKPWSDPLSHLSLGELGERWDNNTVMRCYSPNRYFNRLIRHELHGAALRSQACGPVTFGEFVREDLPRHGEREFVAVSQSPSESLGEFGVPARPPGISLPAALRFERSFWAALPPQTSGLHHDLWDAMMLQLSGTKRFTLVEPMPQLASAHLYYPVLRKQEVVRHAPGVFERGELTDSGVTSFPLVNISHPDLARHPMHAHANVISLELLPGDALMLPAGWAHQVESHLAPSRSINAAVTYWWTATSPTATALKRQFASHRHRARLPIRCEQIAPERNATIGAGAAGGGALPRGLPHPCRLSAPDF